MNKHLHGLNDRYYPFYTREVGRPDSRTVERGFPLAAKDNWAGQGRQCFHP